MNQKIKLKCFYDIRYIEADHVADYLAGLSAPYKWRTSIKNMIPDAAKNTFLDSIYSGTWYMGLIDGTGFTALDLGDTMAAHAGWTEFTGYTQSNRLTITFDNASAASKTLLNEASFQINTNGTINGAFISSNNTKSGTTGTLASQGSFADSRIVSSGGLLNANYTIYIA